jgi:GT2 family glycosyltransferase
VPEVYLREKIRVKMDVSIVIVSFNTAELTLGCLKSIWLQTKGNDIEVIVIDNASRDHSSDRIASEFPQVLLIRNKVNVGTAAATTQGLKMAKGRYVIAMNSDIVILDRALDKLVKFMDTNRGVGGATPKLLFGNLTPHWPPFGNHPTPFTEMREILSDFMGRLLTYSSRYMQNEVDLDIAQEVDCVVWGSCFMVRRSAMENIGYQDPQFFVYCEDVDWSMRLRKAGWKLWYVPEARVIHFGGQSADGQSAKMVRILMMSRIKLMQKHYGMLAGVALRAWMAIIGFCGYIKWLVLPALPISEWLQRGHVYRARFKAMLGAALLP